METTRNKKKALDNLANLLVKPELFTVEDIISIAALLKKTPAEIFGSILTELGKINTCVTEEGKVVPEEGLHKSYNHCHN